MSGQGTGKPEPAPQCDMDTHTNTHVSFALSWAEGVKLQKKKDEIILYDDAVPLFLTIRDCPWLSYSFSLYVSVCVCVCQTEFKANFHLTLFAHIVTAGIFLHWLCLYLWSVPLYVCDIFYSDSYYNFSRKCWCYFRPFTF